MLLVFQAVAVLGITSLLADAVLRVGFGLKDFGVKKRFFVFESRTIPLHRFFPHTLGGMFLFSAAFGMIGMIISMLKLEWVLTLPFSVVGSMWAMYLYNSIYEHLHNKYKPEQLEGKIGRCVQAITPDLYGVIEIETPHGCLTKNAVSVDGNRTIPPSTEVIVVSVEDDLCFVETADYILDVLNQDEINPEPTQNPPSQEEH